METHILPTGDLIKAYSTLGEALLACYKDINCNLVFDVDCDEYMYWTHTGGLVDNYDIKLTESYDQNGVWTISSALETTSCAWVASKRTKFSYIQ